MTMEEQKIAAHLANTMSNSLKGRPALGGLSSGSKLAVKALGVEPYTIDGVALIHIFGISTHNIRAVQVDMPGVALKHAKEGTENSNFWAALGGKQNYASKKELHFLISLDLLTEDTLIRDLLTEDTLILDTHAEVFVWVGHTVDPKEKQKAFEMGEKYIALAASLEGLPQQVPLYKITEGNEPCFFTTYFYWDSEKAIVQGNSFQKKVMLLFGISHAVEVSKQI
ncbi:hypothetical protein V2J09_022560 [Rumex salicifolius]